MRFEYFKSILVAVWRRLEGKGECRKDRKLLSQEK